MPYLSYPNSDAQRITFMRISLSTAKNDAAAKPLLPDDLMMNLENVATAYNATYDLLNSSLSHRQKEVREKNEAMSSLSINVRDFFAVLKRRTYRKEHPTEIFRLYGILSDGELPKISREADLLVAAEAIVFGDKKAVESGYPAMSNPSASEVQEKLVAARKEISEVAPADRVYNEVQKDLEMQRGSVDELIREISDTIQFVLRKHSVSNIRRIMRTYGFTYRYLKGEKQKAEVLKEKQEV